MSESVLEAGRAVLPLFGAVISSVLIIVLIRRLLGRRPAVGRSARWNRQLTPVGIGVVGVFALVLLLPVDAETRNQLIGLLGVAITGIIALSSTTFVTNAMAGLMLRALRNFKPGDWIMVGDQFGRVSEQGLLHTEIQTEDRDLTTIPNLFMVTQPVKVVRASGTIVSAQVSLGYDSPRSRVKEVLIEAAEQTGLTEPFVQITELGDFSVGYRVGGLLSDVATLVGTRSRLRVAMIDGLHGADVEIVSPTFMNQRQISEPVLGVPATESVHDVEAIPHEAPQSVAFDKATRASQRTMISAMMAERTEALDATKKAPHSSPEEAAQAVESLEGEINALGDLLEALSTPEE